MKCWGVVPAAGVGKRMGSTTPKQYLPLKGRTVLEHTLSRLLAEPRIQAIAVAVSDRDDRWSQLSIAEDPRITRAQGGRERGHSVLNGLKALSRADDNDWVLVHDAVRPCLRAEDLSHMIAALRNDSVGGILAHPARDTMKRADAQGRVVQTENRQGLWHALTPQMFRLGRLRHALEQALKDGFSITDEAGAMERAGFQPKLVQGHADNIKITCPEDLVVAECLTRVCRHQSSNRR